MIRVFNEKKIYRKSTAGVPRTPGKWVDTKPTYREMTRILMTCGGGMGGSSWYEVVERINLADLMQKSYVIAKDWEGKEKGLNLQYMVKAEQFTLASARFDNKNTNFKMGVYEYSWLIEDGETIKLIDEFQSEY